MGDQQYALEELQALRGDIDTALTDFLSSKEASLDVPLTEHGEEALEALRDFTNRPGKRIRGALAMRAYRQFGGNNQAAALQVAVAIELVQNYLLIVDDVMDRSPTRRGGPTIHEQYKSQLKNKRQRETQHASNMLAVNVGLLAAHMAFERLASIKDVPAENITAAHIVFQRNVAATGYGQIEDMFNEIEQDVSEQSILTVHELKNSYYTFVNPMQVGALLAGAGENDLKSIKKFGLPAGVAFQLRDDIIGLFGDSQKTGKSALDDLKEGKVTILIHQTLEKADDEQARTIRNAFGNPDVTHKQHEAVKALVESLGARDYTEKLAQTKAEQALEALDVTSWTAEDKRFYGGLIDYIIKRDH